MQNRSTLQLIYQITLNGQRETALQAYLNDLSQLLLDKNLREAEPDSAVAIVAQAKTWSILSQLDSVRQGEVIRFLHDTGLIIIDEGKRGNGKKAIINLEGIGLEKVALRWAHLPKISLPDAKMGGADLREAQLQGANLYRSDLCSAQLHWANLSKADLKEAKLGWADLSEAILIGANLSGCILCGAKLINTDLSEANLSEADLDTANLSGANLNKANLNGVTGITPEELEKQAKSLRGATMPDGSIHP